MVLLTRNIEKTSSLRLESSFSHKYARIFMALTWTPWTPRLEINILEIFLQKLT